MILKRIHFKRKTNFFRFKFKNENELFALWLNKEAVFRFVLKQTVIMHSIIIVCFETSSNARARF